MLACHTHTHKTTIELMYFTHMLVDNFVDKATAAVLVNGVRCSPLWLPAPAGKINSFNFKYLSKPAQTNDSLHTFLKQRPHKNRLCA